ncbi:uncharacterized protein EV154DRAFT_558931 [Mucor mucedo]|uniref:uncharacterized protein n=1 Tax=Mucor mucedo TaxID=29922 RepID=UPI0022201084|nr:uncharacterized protein EV154DRAFT_558931 [Mucor mucedo]KAI7895872.1 hypothetical protein EV154DRAFT_558931 [Mucor mucedo]
MTIEKAVSWNNVYETWRHHFYNLGDEEAKNGFNAFFDPKNFFAPHSPTIGMPLALGISQVDGRYEVVMGLHICEQLIEFLREKLPCTPLPTLSNLSPAKYEIIERFEATHNEILQRTHQKAKKRNKARTKLMDAKKLSALARTLVHGGKYVLVSIDIEAYEMDHSILLEIGWSMYDAASDRFLDQHYAMDTYKHLTNGKFVSDQRMRFNFGTTVWCSLKQALKELRKDLDWAVARDGGFVLVGHGLDSDIKYLLQQKFKWPTADGSETLSVEESAHVAILNTDVIYAASINDLHNPPSLGKTMDLLDIENWNLHNAGNDAHYTLLLLMKLVNKK